MKCFVIMPYHEDFDDVYEAIVASATATTGRLDPPERFPEPALKLQPVRHHEIGRDDLGHSGPRRPEEMRIDPGPDERDDCGAIARDRPGDGGDHRDGGDDAQAVGSVVRGRGLSAGAE